MSSIIGNLRALEQRKSIEGSLFWEQKRRESKKAIRDGTDGLKATTSVPSWLSQMRRGKNLWMPEEDPGQLTTGQWGPSSALNWSFLCCQKCQFRWVKTWRQHLCTKMSFFWCLNNLIPVKLCACCGPLHRIESRSKNLAVKGTKSFFVCVRPFFFLLFFFLAKPFIASAWENLAAKRNQESMAWKLWCAKKYLEAIES